MAFSSTCPKCDHTGFEVKEHRPPGTDYRLTFVQCSACGTVVGTMDCRNLADLIHRLADRLGVDLYR